MYGILVLLLLSINGGIAQKEQRFSFHLSAYQTSNFKKKECCILNFDGKPGLGTEFRFKIGDNSETIKTLIGLSYFQVNYQNFGDLPVGVSTKYRHHILCLPIYLWSDITDKTYIQYHLSLDVPFRSVEKSTSFGEKSILKPAIGGNISMGGGIALGHYFEIEEKYRLFGEVFLKVPTLLSPVRGADDFYISERIVPFLWGLNGGIRF